MFVIGKNEIFLRYGQLERLDSYLAMTRDTNATILQSKFARARLAVKKYRRLRRGAVLCQAQWRMRALKARCSRQRAACIKIQARVRGFQLRSQFLRRRIAVQRIWRVVLRFLTHQKFKRWSVQVKAVVAIQRHIRGFLCRTSAERAKKLRDRSTLALQCWYRMARVRRMYCRQQRAITRIQTQYRSVLLRRRFVAMKRAAIVLAAFIRQVLQRKKFKGLKQRVVKFQALVRGWKLRHSFMLMKRVVLFVQSKRRQQRAAHARLARVHAVAVLQHSMKAWLVRCRYVQMKGGVRVLQHWAKGWLLRKDFRRMRVAIRRIQKSWRRFNRRRRWELELASVFRASNKLVGTSWTHHTKMEDSDRRIHRLRQNPPLYFALQPKAYGYNSLFHHTSACGDLHVVKYMLDNNHLGSDDVLLFLKNGSGNTAFHEACANGQYEIVKLLASRMKIPGANSPEDHSPGPECDAAIDDRLEQQQQSSPPPVQPASGSSRVIYSGYLRKRRET